MNIHTTIGAALMKACDAQPHEYAFGAAVITFLAAGGSVERAHDLVDAAASRKRGDGLHSRSQDLALVIAAVSASPIGPEVLDVHAPQEANERVTSAPTYNEVPAGETMEIMPAHVGPAVLVSPRRIPSAGQQQATLRVARASAASILDTLLIDGRCVGDWTVAEARTAGRTKTREGYILIKASRVVANADPTAKLREVVKTAEMEAIVSRASEMADVI